MIKIWSWISNLGITESMDFDLRKRARIINQFCILTTFTLIVFILINIYNGKLFLAGTEFFIGLVFGYVIWLNKTQRFNTSRILFYGFLLLFFTLLSYFLATGRNLEYFYLLTVILPLILFDQKWLAGLLAVVSYLLMIGSSLYTTGYIDVVHYLNHLALVAFVYYLVLYFQGEYDTNRAIIDRQINELKKLDEEKNQLISIASHDLRSPLNRAQGLLSIIQISEKMPENELKDILDRTQAILKQQQEMISKVLSDYVLSEQKNLTVKPIPFNVYQILSNSIAGFFQEAHRKNIQLSLQGPTEVEINTDLNLFTQIFDNLISNAIKFSYPKSEVHVIINTTDEYISIEVIDQGQGLSAEDQAKLFLKFQKLSAQPTFGEVSTGLGLAIVKKYIEALKGQIKVISEQGKGATFRVELPFNQ